MHLHLQEAVLEGNLPSVLRRAGEAGVSYFLCNGSAPGDWPDVLRLAQSHAAIIPCFGLHPWYVESRPADWAATLEAFLDKIPSGVGEIGLDRWKEPRDEAGQRAVFLEQLDLARQKNRPVMIHCLRAWGDLEEILRREKPLPAGFLLHAFGGPANLIPRFVRLGGYFSFAGNILDRAREKLRLALRTVPEDRLLLETDSPDFPPLHSTGALLIPTAGGKPANQPANLGLILRAAADIRGVCPDELAQSLWENSRRFLEPIRSL